jgi:hypothetical protein
MKELVDIENTVVRILVDCGKNDDAWMAPIHAVDRAPGWHTAKTRIFVEELRDRGRIRVRQLSYNLLEDNSSLGKREQWWEEVKPESAPS